MDGFGSDLYHRLCLLMDTYKTYNSANVHLGLVPAFYSMLPAILLSVRRKSLLERVVFTKFSTCFAVPISSDFVWCLFFFFQNKSLFSIL